jgi:hypothetical protein
MMALVPEDSNALLNGMFLRLLPENMRAVLNDKGHLPPRKLAAAAALLHHPRAGAAAVTAAAAQHRNCHLPDHNCPLPDHNRRLPDRNRHPLQQPPASSNLCFYHYNFRAQARKCRQPCARRSRSPASRTLIAAPAVVYATTPASGAALIYLKNSRTHTHYLVDTGAALSLLPQRSSEPASGPPLVNASGRPISAWGFSTKNLTYGRNVYKHCF